MKGKYFYLCAALFALNSCTNEINEDGFVDKTNTISFSAYPNKTRTVNGDVTSDNMKDDNFGVAGYTENNGIYLYKKDNRGNMGVQQTWNGTSWEYADLGDLKYWPNGTMDFYAYFPYSDNATFAASDASGDVMTITGTTCNHDVLFAKATSSKIARVPLTFHHAFSKIKALMIEMPVEGNLFKSKCQVTVKKVEFINTSTSGDIKVDNAGIASYTVASSNVTLAEDLTSPVTINSTVDANGTPTNNSKALIDNGTKAEGYLFATNLSSAATNNVKGTGKTLWDGTNTSWDEGTTLETLGQVCLKLTCKVWNGEDNNKYYYVGHDNIYGEIYIPISTSTDPNSTALLAGKRYTYIIKMKDNVGFTNAGDPILTPILFEVSNVDTWGDVTVTITL